MSERVGNLAAVGLVSLLLWVLAVSDSCSFQILKAKFKKQAAVCRHCKIEALPMSVSGNTQHLHFSGCHKNYECHHKCCFIIYVVVK